MNTVPARENAPTASANPFGTAYPIVNLNGKLVHTDEARVSIHANALSYGTGTFEGIRAFWNPRSRQLYLLEAVEHYRRFHRSARILGLPLSFSVDKLVDMTCELLRANDVRADAYIRPLLFLSGEVLTVKMHGIEARLTMAASPLPGSYINTDGVRCMVSTWRRPPDVSTPIRAKVIGSYVGNALAKTEAVQSGYDEAIMLTADGFVAEASTSNILVRSDGEWSTPPPTDDILAGITRRRVMELVAETTGKTVIERRIQRSELYSADEMLLCGTAAAVAPVVEVDGRSVGDGKPGEQSVMLRNLFLAIARGDDPSHPESTMAVYDNNSPVSAGA